jgi:hypothetical protein
MNPMYKNKMTIKDGKFYKNDTHVPTEHGNKEQIELMNKVNSMMTDGIQPEIRIQQLVSFEFDCVCGACNEFQFDPFDVDDDPAYMLKGQIQSCHCCNLEYQVFIDEEDEMMIKIISKKP